MASAFGLTFRGGSAWVYSRYWLATLVRASYHPGPSLHQQALAAADGGWYGYAASGGASGGALPLWFVARSGPRKVVVVLCGTLLPVTWYNHLAGGLGMTGGPWPGLAHSFWAANGAALAGAVGAAVGPVDKSDWYLAGHSWGGACAQTTAFYLAQKYATGTVEIVTLGCPRVGNAAYAAGFNDYFWLWGDQNPFDPVPWVPPTANATLVGFLSAATLQSIQSYRPAGIQYRWPRGLGPVPNYPGGSGPITSSATALSALLRGVPSVRPHLAFYYALKWYRESRLLAGGSFDAARRDALNFGYDLDEIDAANAKINAAEGLPPVWPLAPSLEP